MNISKYLKEIKAELKEVKFPTTSQTIIYTIAVIAISVAVAIVLGGEDLGLRTLLRHILTR